MAGEVGRKISKLREEGIDQDRAEAIALDMKERGELDSPPQGVQGFTQTPNPQDSTPSPPDSYSQTPDRSDPETADAPVSRNRADAQAGRPDGTQDFGSGAEQRGTTPQTLRADVDTSPPSGGGDARPNAVQEFDQGEDV